MGSEISAEALVTRSSEEDASKQQPQQYKERVETREKTTSSVTPLSEEELGEMYIALMSTFDKEYERIAAARKDGCQSKQQVFVQLLSSRASTLGILRGSVRSPTRNNCQQQRHHVHVTSSPSSPPSQALDMQTEGGQVSTRDDALQVKAKEGDPLPQHVPFGEGEGDEENREQEMVTIERTRDDQIPAARQRRQRASSASQSRRRVSHGRQDKEYEDACQVSFKAIELMGSKDLADRNRRLLPKSFVQHQHHHGKQGHHGVQMPPKALKLLSSADLVTGKARSFFLGNMGMGGGGGEGGGRRREGDEGKLISPLEAECNRIKRKGTMNKNRWLSRPLSRGFSIRRGGDRKERSRGGGGGGGGGGGERGTTTSTGAPRRRRSLKRSPSMKLRKGSRSLGSLPVGRGQEREGKGSNEKMGLLIGGDEELGAMLLVIEGRHGCPPEHASISPHGTNAAPSCSHEKEISNPLSHTLGKPPVTSLPSSPTKARAFSEKWSTFHESGSLSPPSIASLRHTGYGHGGGHTGNEDRWTCVTIPATTGIHGKLLQSLTETDKSSSYSTFSASTLPSIAKATTIKVTDTTTCAFYDPAIDHTLGNLNPFCVLCAAVLSEDREKVLGILRVTRSLSSFENSSSHMISPFISRLNHSYLRSTSRLRDASQTLSGMGGGKNT